MEEQLANQLAQRVGISQEQARTVITLVSKTLLQKAEPSKASGLLSKLPSSITSPMMKNNNLPKHNKI
jgi:hypothetical protein